MNTCYILVTVPWAYSDELHTHGPCLSPQSPTLSCREPPRLKYLQLVGDRSWYPDPSLGLGASLLESPMFIPYGWARAGARAMFYSPGLTRYPLWAHHCAYLTSFHASQQPSEVRLQSHLMDRGLLWYGWASSQRSLRKKKIIETQLLLTLKLVLFLSH